jgi:hypothetical protein
MSNMLVFLVTCAYAATAIDLYMRHDLGHAIMFAGYALANVGLIMALK